MTCHEFRNAIQVVPIDMSIKISMDLDNLHRKKTEAESTITTEGNSNYAVRTIHYGETPNEKSYQLYIKSSGSKGGTRLTI